MTAPDMKREQEKSNEANQQKTAEAQKQVQQQAKAPGAEQRRTAEGALRNLEGQLAAAQETAMRRIDKQLAADQKALGQTTDPQAQKAIEERIKALESLKETAPRVFGELSKSVVEERESQNKAAGMWRPANPREEAAENDKAARGLAARAQEQTDAVNRKLDDLQAVVNRKPEAVEE